MAELVGRRFPALALPATTGGTIDLSKQKGLVILVCYPYTGRPGTPDPENWDRIPGAHGSTPQLQAFSERYDQFRNLDVKLFGLSFQSPDWQLEFTERNDLRVPLLSDQDHLFAVTLSLPTFATGGASFLKRQTLIARDATIIAAHRPMVPASDAAETLALFVRS